MKKSNPTAFGVELILGYLTMVGQHDAPNVCYEYIIQVHVFFCMHAC